MKKLNNKQRARLFKFILVLYTACLCYLCFGQFNGIQKAPQFLFGIPTDKIEHFCMFFPFPIIYYLCFKTLARKPGKAILWTLETLAVGAVFAAATELIQRNISYRCGDWSDFLVDVLALAAGCIVTLILNLKYSLERAFK